MIATLKCVDTATNCLSIRVIIFRNSFTSVFKLLSSFSKFLTSALFETIAEAEQIYKETVAAQSMLQACILRVLFEKDVLIRLPSRNGSSGA